MLQSYPALSSLVHEVFTGQRAAGLQEGGGAEGFEGILIVAVQVGSGKVAEFSNSLTIERNMFLNHISRASSALI